MTSHALHTRRLTVLRAAAMFDGASSTLTARPSVVVADGVIAAVHGPAGPVPPGAHVMDLPGLTLMPGLVDAHLHLCFDATGDPVGHLAQADDDTLRERMAGAARRALRAGVTTVRDLGDRGYLALELRDRGPAGGAGPLPAIVAAGPPITTPGGHCHFLGGAASGERALRAAVRERAERGVDVIKVMASGGNMTPGSLPYEPQFGAASLRVIVDEAHHHGLPVTAHAHSARSVADAVAAGVDGDSESTVEFEAWAIQALAEALDPDLAVPAGPRCERDLRTQLEQSPSGLRDRGLAALGWLERCRSAGAQATTPGALDEALAALTVCSKS